MSTELTRVDAWLQSLLKGDTALSALATDVYGDVADTGATGRYVVHQYMGAADVQGVGPNRIMISGLWLVRAVQETRSWADLAPTADRIDFLLQGNLGGAAGTDGAVFSSVRERPHKLIEAVEGGGEIRNLGGTYRIEAQVP